MLELKDLSVTYKTSTIFGKKSEYNAVKHVNLSIRQGEIMGLVGESGCGKSTLSRAILGMLDDAEITGEIIHYTRRPQMVFQERATVLPGGKKVPEGFSYSSGNNTEWLTVEQIRELLKTIDLEK